MSFFILYCILLKNDSLLRILRFPGYFETPLFRTFFPFPLGLRNSGVQLYSLLPNLSATMWYSFAQLFLQCWCHACALQMFSKVFWVVLFPRCTAGTGIVRSCCISQHTTANKDAATPNIVGPTLMLGVVASVCTKLYHFYRITQTFFLIVCPFDCFTRALFHC